MPPSPTSAADAVAIVYLNGQYLPRDQAHLDIEDRGCLFADGVYEVIAYFNGQPLAMRPHVARMRHSLAAIGMDPAFCDGLDVVSTELAARNRLDNALIYWQITRGAAPRNPLPPADIQPTILVIAYRGEALDPAAPPHAIRVALAEDQRWHRCDIKSLMLLANIMAMRQAREQGCDDVILHRGDRVTEAARTSVFAVRRGELWTHPADQWILASITRGIVIDLAGELGMTLRQQAVTIEQLRAADEVFTCGTGSRLQAVTHIEGRPIADGRVGPVTTRLHQIYMRHIAASCGLGATVTSGGGVSDCTRPRP
jgi:D-alanine transaminase